MHKSTFEYLKPTPQQLEDMQKMRAAAAEYAAMIHLYVPEGADKAYVERLLRTMATWVNIAITRLPDGSPR